MGRCVYYNRGGIAETETAEASAGPAAADRIFTARAVTIRIYLYNIINITAAVRQSVCAAGKKAGAVYSRTDEGLRRTKRTAGKGKIGNGISSGEGSAGRGGASERENADSNEGKDVLRTPQYGAEIVSGRSDPSTEAFVHLSLLRGGKPDTAP